MVDFSNNSEIKNASVDLQEIAQTLNNAISNQYPVEIRIEDLPRMNIDSTLSTNVIKAGVDEEIKYLSIQANGIDIKFKYKSFGLGTASAHHKKFYFESEGAILTIIVNF